MVTILDVTVPDIRFEGNVTLDEDTTHVFDASATTDNDPGFNASNGRFHWEIDLSDGTLVRELAAFGYEFTRPGNYSGFLEVTDIGDNLARVDFWVLVRDITAPYIEGVADSTVFDITPGLLDASACSDNVAIVSYDWEVEFRGGITDLSGVFPDFSFDHLGTYNVTLVLSDAAGNTNRTDITVVFDDVPTINMPSWVVAMAGERLTVGITVSDVYSIGLEVSVVTGPIGATVQGPSDAPFLVWTPGSEHAGTEVVLDVEVFDGFKSSHVNITIRVNPARGAGNRPPVVVSSPPLAARMASPYIYSVQAIDPDGDVLGYLLTVAPEGMSISQVGTISWDPPYDHGVVLVDVSLVVTDGRDSTTQSWTVRWRDPPNRPPVIPFTLPPLEIYIRETFLVDLSIHVVDPGAYSIDEDDPNQALTWSLDLDDQKVVLVGTDGLVYQLQALDMTGITTVNFTVTDPSGASDTIAMELAVLKKGSSGGDDGLGWLLWPVLVVLAAIVLLGIAARKWNWQSLAGSGDHRRRRPRSPPPTFRGPSRTGRWLRPRPSRRDFQRTGRASRKSRTGWPTRWKRHWKMWKASSRSRDGPSRTMGWSTTGPPPKSRPFPGCPGSSTMSTRGRGGPTAWRGLRSLGLTEKL